MDRLSQTASGVLLLLAALTVSCGPPKTGPVPPPVPNTGAVFPERYFPAATPGLWGWARAVVYDQALLDERQKAWVASLEPAGGEGQVGLGFTRDFDGDGRTESVMYGAFADEAGREGNFVLIVREGTPSSILLRKELPGPPRFTVFTLKPDGSLWFGGGIDAGEVTMNITWDHGAPVFRILTE